MKKLLPFLLFSVGLFAQTGKMKFEATITNPNSDSLVISNKDFVKVLRARNGIFRADFEIPAGFYQLFEGKQFAFVFLEPDFDLHIQSDGLRFYETMKFFGRGADENQFLMWKKRTDDDFKNGFNGRLPDLPELEKVLAKRSADADQKLKRDKLDATFVNLMRDKYRTENAEITRDLIDAKGETNRR